jgi:hypothetical protein
VGIKSTSKGSVTLCSARTSDASIGRARRRIFAFRLYATSLTDLLRVLVCLRISNYHLPTRFNLRLRERALQHSFVNFRREFHVKERERKGRNAREKKASKNKRKRGRRKSRTSRDRKKKDRWRLRLDGAVRQASSKGNAIFLFWVLNVCLRILFFQKGGNTGWCRINCVCAVKGDKEMTTSTLSLVFVSLAQKRNDAMCV